MKTPPQCLKFCSSVHANSCTVGSLNEKIYKNCVTSTSINVFRFYGIQQAIHIADVWLTVARLTEETKHWLREQNF
jgi:hypothetical protein